MAKSILYQLKQYQPDKAPVIIEVEDSMALPGFDQDELNELTERIVATSCVPPHRRYEYWKVVRDLLAGLPKHENMGVVYPAITAARYYLFYAHQHSAGEGATDKELMEFMKGIPPEEFIQRFLPAFNEGAKRLALYRALVATFPEFKKRADKLPGEWRRDILGALRIRCDRVGLAQDLLEGLQRSLGVNEIILGRLGYMIIHSSHTWPRSEPGMVGMLPRLLAHKPQK